jgi:ribosomal protein S18 acetylase RimI-like enzyme
MNEGMGLLFTDNSRGNINKKQAGDFEQKSVAPSSGYRVEKAQLTDMVPMLNLWKATPGLGVGKGDGEDSLRDFMQRNPSTCLVLRIDEGIVATVLGGFDGRRGYIYHLAVHPDYQGKGYGKVLLNQVISELKSLGALKIHLFVFNDNQLAAGFYNHQGWELRQDIQVFSWDATLDNK